MKNNFIKSFIVAVSAFAMISCDSPSKMAELADQITFKCNPEVLEVVAGAIEADITVNFPAEFFHPKAIMEVTPVLVYQGGEVAYHPFIYQGEKITDNYRLVSEDGAQIREKVAFKYVPGMEKSHLELRGKVLYKDKVYNVAEAFKIADGANTTYMLVNTDGVAKFAKDNYQEVITENEEAQIHFLVNSAQVRNSELKSQDLKDYKETLAALEGDARRTIVGTDVVSYASPEGSEKFNNKLSDKRGENASKALSKFMKGVDAGEISVKSIGEDWEGFQDMVAKSDLEDKDLIIRVLSMYSDPNVREREIRNMSNVYKTLADDVLPQLRRSRFITSVEYTNYTPEELAKIVEENIDILDEEAILRAAALTKDNNDKIDLYAEAIKKFNSDRAKYNSAVVYLEEGKVEKAADVLAKVENQDADYNNVKGIVAMRQGNLEEAAKYLKAANTPEAKANLAAIDILNGDYYEAATKLAGTGDENEALAYILTDQLGKASDALKCKCPHASYLKAIVAARKGDVDRAKAELENAGAEYAKRAETDIEFAKVK
ncbi:MAG: hypothetical protein IKL26_03665 [Bacteroidales bacterium]|nr:hypothetical protein [Bacteroidales bacterium]